MRQQNKNGFTLVELAIALMVIGLLIGGVLKGQELIENARVTALVRQLKAYDAAAMIFRSGYGALPGDIKKPESRVPNCTSDLCRLGGDGNGRVFWGTTPNGLELYNFFPHMTKAGVIQGPEGGTVGQMSAAPFAPDEDYEFSDEYYLFYPTTPIEGRPLHMLYYEIGMMETGSLKPGHYYVLDGIISGKQAFQIDTKIDDGIPNKGSVFDNKSNEFDDDNGLAECVVNNESGTGYDYDVAEGRCYLIMGAGF